MAEIELSMLSRQCLKRRLPNVEARIGNHRPGKSAQSTAGKNPLAFFVTTTKHSHLVDVLAIS